MTRILQAQDTTATYKVQLLHETGVTLLYDGTETLSAKLWVGDDRIALATPTVTWNTAPNLVDVLITKTMLSGLEPGIYRLRVYGVGGDVHLAEAELEVVAAPGSRVAPRTYCNAEDLLRIYPGLKNLHFTGEDRAGFEEYRQSATEWIDEVVLANYRPTFQQNEQWLKTQIDAGKLLATPTIRNACARRAVSQILLNQPLLAENKTDYVAQANMHQNLCEQGLMGCRVGFDLNSDALADFYVDLDYTRSVVC